MRRFDRSHALLIAATLTAALALPLTVRAQSDIATLCCDTLPATLLLAGQNIRLSPRSPHNHNRLGWKQFVVPAALVGIGTVPLFCGTVDSWDRELQRALVGNRAVHIDDYAQYAAMIAVYGLNLCGMKGEHNLRDRTILLAASYMIMGLTVNILKPSIGRLRPNGLAYTSFPSGHTATAFMGAEYLRTEYRDSAPWVGIAGYVVAAGVGLLRVYNNAHYLSDVLAGAGIGILSVRAACLIYPTIQRLLFGRHRNSCALTIGADCNHRNPIACLGLSMWL